MRPGHQFLYVSALCVSQLLPFQGHLSGCCWPLTAWWQTSGRRQALCFVPSKLANNPRCALVEVPAAKGEAPFCSESPGFSCLHCVQKTVFKYLQGFTQKNKIGLREGSSSLHLFWHFLWTQWTNWTETDEYGHCRWGKWAILWEVRWCKKKKTYGKTLIYWIQRLLYIASWSGVGQTIPARYGNGNTIPMEEMQWKHLCTQCEMFRTGELD